jgi:hypothetical protein
MDREGAMVNGEMSMVNGEWSIVNVEKTFAFCAFTIDH